MELCEGANETQRIQFIIQHTNDRKTIDFCMNENNSSRDTSALSSSICLANDHSKTCEKFTHSAQRRRRRCRERKKAQTYNDFSSEY